MSEVERLFDRFIDAFAADLLELSRAYIEVEVARAVQSAQKLNLKLSKAELRVQKRQQRLNAKAQLKAKKERAREAKRAERVAAKQQLEAERVAERQTRQMEHDRLKQERLALKHELEAERRRLREASRKRPARQIPLDFDGLRTPKPRRRDDRPAPGSPPPLFVHKRKRDGQIEKLAREPDGAVGAPVSNSAPSSPVNGAAILPAE